MKDSRVPSTASLKNLNTCRRGELTTPKGRSHVWYRGISSGFAAGEPGLSPGCH